MIKKSNISVALLIFIFLQSYNNIFPQTLSLKSKIDTLLDAPFFQRAQISAVIYDLTSDTLLYTKNEKLLMHPASNLKVLTSSAALVFLGTDYYFTTSVYHTGVIKDSVCFGDVYVVGGGDPEFTTPDLDSLIIMIKNYGIREITGNLYGDVSMCDSLYFGSGWMWDDDPHLFSPYLTPLIINKTGVKVACKPGEPGQPPLVNVIPESGFYTFENNATTVAGDSIVSRIKITRDWLNRKNTISVNGYLTTGVNPDTVSLNLYNPAKYFLKVMSEHLNKAGIILLGSTDTSTYKNNGELICSFQRPITPVLKQMNKESDNLNAEMVLRALALKYAGKPAYSKNGIKMVDSLITLTGFDPHDYRIADGCGLSWYNLISTELLSGALKYIYNDKPLFDILYDSFPIAGTDGTLETRMTHSIVTGNVHGKTGTLSGVSALSGYMTDSKEHIISFSILVQNYKGSSSAAHYFIDKICELIAEK